jgi:glycogen debranching enzyme
LGQVSEIFDGDPPFASRGCIAQAWSVAELLRIAKSIQ